MKYLDEYRDADAVQPLLKAIEPLAQTPCAIMEICGGQTHSIVKYGIDQLLPKTVTFIHGPGCPVCVTPQHIIDAAITIASIPEVVFCSFGDMLRVPGTNLALFSIKEKGGDVRTVYSPLDALQLARKYPNKQIVFFGAGFETTAPAIAMAVCQAKQESLTNFSVLASNVMVPPALALLLSNPNNRIDGLIAAGHVCTIMGVDEYLPIAKQYRIPIVVTGFEPLDILQGVYMVLKQMHENRSIVEIQYARSVKQDGNPTAKELLRKVFDVADREWRGLGKIPASGLCLRDEYKDFDAEKRFNLNNTHHVSTPNLCISGLILQGLKKPHECPEFGKGCTPEAPIGAPMVSTEGACAAYYRYRRVRMVNA